MNFTKESPSRDVIPNIFFISSIKSYLDSTSSPQTRDPLSGMVLFWPDVKAKTPPTKATASLISTAYDLHAFRPVIPPARSASSSFVFRQLLSWYTIGDV